MHLTVGRASKGEREAMKISDAAEFFCSLTPNSHSLTELSLPSSPKLFVYCPFPAAWADMGLGLGARGERRKRVVSMTRGGQKIMPRARRLVVSHYGDSKTAGSVICTI